MNLYQINENYKSLLEAIENDEIPEEAVSDTLEAVKGERTVKIDNIACYIKNLLAEATEIKVEADALTARMKSKKNKAERLKEYLSSVLAGEKFESPRNKISWRKSEAVEVDDKFVVWAEENNRDDLLKFKDPEADKLNIKQALKDGETFPFAKLVENKNMQIK